MLIILPDLTAGAQIIRWGAIPLLIDMLDSTDDAPAAIEALDVLFSNGVLFFGISLQR